MAGTLWTQDEVQSLVYAIEEADKGGVKRVDAAKNFAELHGRSIFSVRRQIERYINEGRINKIIFSWNDEADRVLVGEYRRNFGFKSVRAIAGIAGDRLHLSQASAHARLWYLIYKGILPRPSDESAYTEGLDLGRWPTFNDFFRIEPPVIACADSHIPFIHLPTLDRMIVEAEETKIRKLVVCGDFLNWDYFCKYRESGGATAKGTEAEMEAADQVLERLLEHFREIYLCLAGHDRRIMVALGFALKPERMLKMIRGDKWDPERIKVSRHSYADVGEYWRLIHPGRARKVKGSLAREMAAKYRKSVVVFHQHYSSLQVDISGEDIAMDCGSLADHDQISYTRLDCSTWPETDHAFVVIDQEERARLCLEHPRYGG